ncbi:SRPBCC family protein [Blastopirellula sp. J2-11]|uniref:SRPBCC family protein n=1 Tax=Blastopirellula sp. J2-11 TaxID=2943192 RepID=UPI0021C75544|nr:SRPBCC family protein [Blastopirellula sp. J2-11]UUO06144.1 SRPBCC family protein [Blastopirellula sp. J2-11]
MNETAAPVDEPVASTPGRRWLKTIVISLLLMVVVVGVLWIVGGQTVHYRAHVRILASPEKIFPYLTEPDLLMQWMEGVVEIKPLTDEGHQAGAKAVAVMERNGDRFEMESEVLKTVPNKELKVRLQNKMFDLVNDYQLKSNGGETDVSIDMEAKFLGWARITAPLIGGAIESKLEADFNQLREKVESKR